MKSLLRVSVLIPASPAGYWGRQRKAAGVLGSDSLSRPCYRLSDRWPGRVPMDTLGGSDLGSNFRPPLLVCVTLGKSKHASEPQFPHLSSWECSGIIVRTREKAQKVHVPGRVGLSKWSPLIRIPARGRGRVEEPVTLTWGNGWKRKQNKVKVMELFLAFASTVGYDKEI